MDDIQTWIYIIIAVVYFIIRSFKNKQPQKQARQAPPSQPGHRPDSERRKPLTFEELLQEFTEGRKEEGETSGKGREEEVEEESFEEESRSQRLEREGRDRQFSDEESKRVYEESIKNAEGSSMSFEREDEFKLPKRASRDTLEEEADTFHASNIKEMLQSPEDARKAVILSEILGRKY